MVEQNDKKFLIEYFPFYNDLSAKQQDLLSQNTMPAQYKKGTSLNRANDNCIGTIIVKKGQLRVYILYEDGRDITLYRLFSGDICVLSASCILDTITFDIFIDIEEDSELLITNSYTMNKLVEENIYVKSYVYEQASQKFSDVMWTMQQILFMGFDKRLAIFLWDEITKSNSNEIKLTHEQIAKYIGSAREVVTRMLKYFANENIVSLSRGTIKVLDKKKLQKIINSNRK